MFNVVPNSCHVHKGMRKSMLQSNCGEHVDEGEQKQNFWTKPLPLCIHTHILVFDLHYKATTIFQRRQHHQPLQCQLAIWGNGLGIASHSNTQACNVMGYIWQFMNSTASRLNSWVDEFMSWKCSKHVPAIAFSVSKMEETSTETNACTHWHNQYKLDNHVFTDYLIDQLEDLRYPFLTNLTLAMFQCWCTRDTLITCTARFLQDVKRL